MAFPIEVTRLRVHFGSTRAVDDVSFTLPAGVVCGVLGRNGAGKSTLLSTLAAYRRPTAGLVRVDGADPYENARLMSEICLVREHDDCEPSMSVREILTLARHLRPRWDAAFADRLVERFGLNLRSKVRDLPRGRRAALSVTVGLASRAPLTMFDEAHLGMDAPSRSAFYDELRADHLAHPRTVLISTHLIDEVAPLLEDVVIIHQGRLLAHAPADELRSLGTEAVGPADAIEELVGDSRVLAQRQLGSTRSVVLFERLSPERTARAVRAGVEISPIPLQELFTHLTGPHGPGRVEVTAGGAVRIADRPADAPAGAATAETTAAAAAGNDARNGKTR